MRLVYWTNYPNVHQRALIDALRAAGHDVEVCYFDRYAGYRALLGWVEPEALPPQERRVRTLRAARAAIPDYDARTVLLGGYSHPVFWANALRCALRRQPWALIAEKSRGRARSWPVRRLFGALVNRAAIAAFGLGPEAVDDLLRGWGVRLSKVAGFAYATPGISERRTVNGEQNAPQGRDGTSPAGNAGHTRPFRFVFAGAFTRRKAVDVLARAWAAYAPAHPEATLRLVGAGPLGGCFAGLPRVERWGVCPPERIDEALAGCDCGILPSRFDGWGMVVAEYARAGLTLIATQTCGAAEPLIRPGRNGFIVPPGDILALTQALEDAPGLRADAGPLAATAPERLAAALVRRLEGYGEVWSPPRHLLHVVAGCWADGGGLSELVASIVLAQARQGYRVTLAFLGGQAEHPLVRACRRAGATVCVFPRARPHAPYFSRAMARVLPRLVRRATQVHIHCCWTFPVWWAAMLARFYRVPYAISPQGSLDPVRRAYGRLRKALAWACFDWGVFRHAAWVHATAPVEAEWVRGALGRRCPPVRVIPNGVDGDLLDAAPAVPREKSFLYLGRLHPLKGLDLLGEAWAASGLAAEGWRLVVAGPADGAAPPAGPGIEIRGPLHGAEKARALKSAACLVLPTRSENFGIVVAEALWCRTPVICTRGAPWPELGDFWVDVSADALAAAMRRFAALSPEAREAAFARRFAWARAQFAWPALAARLAEP